jgi:hypothetical protein
MILKYYVARISDLAPNLRPDPVPNGLPVPTEPGIENRLRIVSWKYPLISFDFIQYLLAIRAQKLHLSKPHRHPIGPSFTIVLRMKLTSMIISINDGPYFSLIPAISHLFAQLKLSNLQRSKRNSTSVILD